MLSVAEVLQQQQYLSGSFPFSLEPDVLKALAEIDLGFADRYVASVVSAYGAFVKGDQSLTEKLKLELNSSGVPGVKGEWGSPRSPRSVSPVARVDEVRALPSWRSGATSDLVKSGEQLADRDGYCYLWIIRPDRRVAMSTVLGRWPLLEDVMALGVADVDFDGPRDLQLVRQGDVVHVRPASESWGGENLAEVFTMIASQMVGTGSKAVAVGSLGAHYCLPLESVPASHCAGDTLVGGGELELVSGSSVALSVDQEKQIADAKRSLAGLVSERDELSSGFVWVPEDDSMVMGKRQYCQHSVILHLSPASERRKLLTLAVPNRAIVRLPFGWKIRVRDVLVGNNNSSVSFGFREACEVELVPPLDGFVGYEAVVIMGKRVDWALDLMLGPKTTDARFVRAMGFPTVLRFPQFQERALEGSFQCVAITDPLETWNAVEEVRLQSKQSGLLSDTGAYGLVAYKNFRTNGSAEFKINDFAELESREAGVVVLSGLSMRTSNTGSESEQFEWSLRRLMCVDDYCMDNGGPSDSEFSDAV